MLHPTRMKNEGENLSRHLELSGRRRTFAQKRRQGKRAARKAVCMKHKVTRARPRLDELALGTFNVCRAAVNGVNSIGDIDTLLRPWAVKGCDVIGLQETKRDGTFEIVASGCHVFFSGDCSGLKGRKGQHGVGLAMKEKSVKNDGKDGIAIKCIGARLLKTQTSIKSHFFTFRSLRPDRGSAGGAEGQKYCRS